MSQFFGVMVAAIIVEGIISYVKLFFVGGKFQWQVLVSIGLGVLVSVAYQIDLFDIVGMESTIPYVGIVLTGILISRGSNYVYELIKLIISHQKDKPEAKT